MHIDLKDLALSESERVEWKENGDDLQIAKKITKTISAFANDLSNFGGGYVVCGAQEGKDDYGFPKLQFTGLSANKLKEIEGKVTQLCRDQISPSISPIVHELDNPQDPATRILVFVVIASPDAHIYRDGENSAYFVRVGRETREARNGILMQLLIKKQKVEYFDKRVASNATEADIDVLFFRDCIRGMGLLEDSKDVEDFFSDAEQIAELVPPLFVRTSLDQVLRPRNFTMLLFGKKSSITRLFPDAHTVLSIYPGHDRSSTTAEGFVFTGSILEQSRKSIERLTDLISIAYDKTSAKPNQVNYPVRAIQEAVVNAFVHRDYQIPEPIRITVFTDRIEIMSPGALHWGIDRDKFLIGKSGPKWRNQSFAYLFRKLQLAQSEGQGIPPIFRTMRKEGCPDPVFEIGTESVTCVLYAHERHAAIRAR